MNRVFWKQRTEPSTAIPATPLTLDKVYPGHQVIVTGFQGMDSAQQNFLQAYGLLPGREVTVLQHAPETVVQIEYTELAFEKEVARQVLCCITSR